MTADPPFEAGNVHVKATFVFEVFTSSRDKAVGKPGTEAAIIKNSDDSNPNPTALRA